jgi:hypothetical protein
MQHPDKPELGAEHGSALWRGGGVGGRLPEQIGGAVSPLRREDSKVFEM